MPFFSDEDLNKLTDLCRIECKDQEKENLKNKLSRIINFCSELTQIDTTGVEPIYSVLDEQTLILREDVVSDLLSREQFLENAPSYIGGMIKIPPIFKQNG